MSKTLIPIDPTYPFEFRQPKQRKENISGLMVTGTIISHVPAASPHGPSFSTEDEDGGYAFHLAYGDRIVFPLSLFAQGPIGIMP